MANYHLGSFTKSRIETFSDGVIAIVVTLLVFELRLPALQSNDNAQIAKAILSTLPKLLTWVISFFTVCVFWMNHHRVFLALNGIDAGLFWCNNVFLLFISLVPFPTTVIGSFPFAGSATGFYGVCLGLASFSMFLLRIYVHKNPDLLKGDYPLQRFKEETRLSFLVGPVGYWSGAAAGLISPVLSFVIYSLIPVYFIFPRLKTQTKQVAPME